MTLLVGEMRATLKSYGDQYYFNLCTVANLVERSETLAHHKRKLCTALYEAKSQCDEHHDASHRDATLHWTTGIGCKGNLMLRGIFRLLLPNL